MYFVSSILIIEYSLLMIAFSIYRDVHNLGVMLLTPNNSADQLCTTLPNINPIMLDNSWK